jgi:archaellum biogenesis ATPase FlaH
MDGIKTGLPELDRYLMRFFYGTLNIVTGINGSGKSSLLNQVICQCLDRGENAYLFSGELPNFQAKNWINYIFAGQRNVEEKNYDGSPYYKIKPEAKRAISEYYRGRLFIRKDGESNKKTDILQSMEDSVRKYGCKLLILDNLTAMNLECNDDNKYDKQAEFVMDLIAFAVKFNVALILVVHPHKIEAMRRLSKMDVQGISAIIDLAHRIISLYRVQERDHQGEPKLNGSGWRVKPIKGDVIIDILKDRLNGYEGRSLEVFYDRPSKRFFTTEEELDYQYGWDKTKYTTPLPFPPQQLMETDDEDEVFGEAM